LRRRPGLESELHACLGLATECKSLAVQDACTGFLTGLDIASGYLTTGQASQILLVTADAYSEFFDNSDLSVSPLFSDGAAAFTLHDPGEDIPASSKTLSLVARQTIFDGTARDLLQIQGRSSDRQELSMRGGGVFSFVVAHLPEALSAIRGQLGDNEFSNTAWFIHQGSKLVVDHVAAELGHGDKDYFAARDYGNTVSSSIPFQLIDRWESINPGDSIGFITFGMGMAISISVYAVS